MFVNIDDDFLNYHSGIDMSKFYHNGYDKVPYHSFNQDKSDVLSPKEGLTIGNMFLNSYIPYKHYKPRELKARSEREELLLKIQELCFAQNDLNLFLDMHPDDQKMYGLFKEYTKEAKRLSDIYSEKYGPLELNNDLGASYGWYKNPWPWEVSDNV
ncbi:MAG: spore coat protein CotJB [Mollicutes bacterium]|nr:spore coat protein CotJB [Mollicutes bacterium]